VNLVLPTRARRTRAALTQPTVAPADRSASARARPPRTRPGSARRAVFLLATVLATVLAAVVAASSVSAASAHTATTFPVTITFNAGLTGALVHPHQPPPGANVPGCRPSPEHPHPVVLVNGTFANQYDNWAGMAPTLANAGYCVFTFDYGKTSLPFFYELGPMAASQTQLSTFVDQVLSTTGATQVDLVGHSQGGLLTESYVKFLGGSDKVSAVVLLSPTTHGTTLNGQATEAGVYGLSYAQVGSVCAACLDQVPTAAFVAAVNNGGVTVSGVRYTVVETANETTVTPAPTAAFVDEPGVANVTVQDYCPSDSSQHADLVYSPTAWHLTTNALDPDHATPVGCT
jgi:triacylglycerol esterase/lipase EstA (alpha/beta hydrolase family)